MFVKAVFHCHHSVVSMLEHVASTQNECSLNFINIVQEISSEGFISTQKKKSFESYEPNCFEGPKSKIHYSES